MSSMILGGCIPSPKKQTEAITVEENPNMMYMLVGSYATPEEEGIKVYNFDEQNGNSQYISGIKGISNPSFLIPSADGERIYAVGIAGLDHVYEKPFHKVDFIWSQNINKAWDVKLSIDNILNPYYERVLGDGSQIPVTENSLIVQSYKRGTGFSLGASYKF